MPLYQQWRDGTLQLAIWKIEEDEYFFQQCTGLQSKIAHQKRRIEFLAGRFLLQYLQPDFPIHLITTDEHGKPSLPDCSMHFSVSHSYPYVAVVISDQPNAGVDIQVWHRRMEVLQHKYLSAHEQSFFQNDSHFLTVAWNVKEALYKWNGKNGLDFIHNLKILEHYSTQKIMSCVVVWGGKKENLLVKYLISRDFSMAYILNERI